MRRTQNADTHALKHRISCPKIFPLSAPVLYWLSHLTCISNLKAKNVRKTLIFTQLQISRYNQHFFAIFRWILINWPPTYLLQSDHKLKHSTERKTGRFRTKHLILQCIVPVGFLSCENRVAFLWVSQFQQSRATQPTVHAGCFSVHIIHRILTWTTRSLTFAQLFIHAIAHCGWVCGHRNRVCTESRVGGKIPCRIEKSNLRQRRASPTFYHQNLQ